MDGWTLCFVLLLPLTVCEDSEVTLVKTLGSKSDVTPLCTNGTMNIITLIVCKISTERNRGEQCRLLYQYGKDFEHGCGSRFRLMTENQTVFLHLSSLTAEDSGNYTCECSRIDGTFILHLSITVEEKTPVPFLTDIFFNASGEEESSSSTEILIAFVLIGATIVIVKTGIIVIIQMIKCHRVCLRSATSGKSLCESPSSANQYDQFSCPQQPTNDLKQTVSSTYHEHDTRTSSADIKQEVAQTETDANCTIYENINKYKITV